MWRDWSSDVCSDLPELSLEEGTQEVYRQLALLSSQWPQGTASGGTQSKAQPPVSSNLRREGLASGRQPGSRSSGLGGQQAQPSLQEHAATLGNSNFLYYYKVYIHFGNKNSHSLKSCGESCKSKLHIICPMILEHPPGLSGEPQKLSHHCFESFSASSQ